MLACCLRGELHIPLACNAVSRLVHIFYLILASRLIHTYSICCGRIEAKTLVLGADDSQQ